MEEDSRADAPQELGDNARRLDSLDVLDRARLGVKRRRRLVGIVSAALLALGVTTGLVLWTDVADPAKVFVAPVILLSFLLQSLDKAAGMGAGTTLAPLLLLIGYEPLAVVPALLVSEAFTGLLAAAMHHQFQNVQFSVRRPWTQATRVAVGFAGFGLTASAVAILTAYLAFDPSTYLIEVYVAVLVLVMGVAGVLHIWIRPAERYRPKLLAFFALLGGANKGLAGGGYGPVVTLGQIFSGVHEKTATAITTLSEGLVSLIAVLAYGVLLATGEPVDFTLVVPILMGAVLAAIFAPYLVRIVPRRGFAVFVPLYAVALGFILLERLL